MESTISPNPELLIIYWVLFGLLVLARLFTVESFYTLNDADIFVFVLNVYNF